MYMYNIQKQKAMKRVNVATETREMYTRNGQGGEREGSCSRQNARKKKGDREENERRDKKGDRGVRQSKRERENRR